jgi:hypothetical protein
MRLGESCIPNRDRRLLMTPSRSPLRLLCAAWVAAGLAIATDAPARGIRVDVGSSNYGSDDNGQAWESSEDAVGTAPFRAGTLPFALNVDGTTLGAFCLFPNGTIGFASDCTNVPADAFLNPLASDWTPAQPIPPNPVPVRIFESGSVTYTEGHLAPTSPFPANPDDAPLAVRFHWNDLTCSACNSFTYSFQAILINRGSGDFDIEFNYNDIPAGIGTASILLGSSAFVSTGPFSASVDYDFSFRNGVFVDGTNGVPEPAPLMLLVAAGVALVLTARRRR